MSLSLKSRVDFRRLLFIISSPLAAGMGVLDRIGPGLRAPVAGDYIAYVSGANVVEESYQ